MHAKPEKVATRRVRRRLKAIASIAVALCAGAFLACQKSVTSPRTDAAGVRDGADATTQDASARARGVDAAPDLADASTALVKADSGARDAAAVDRREHRKGMPVPDNLLE